MANYKRKKKISSTSKKCLICGSQRRLGEKGRMRGSRRPIKVEDWKDVIGSVGTA